MMGTSGDKEKLFATAIFGVVKFISAMLCAFFLIDYIGRKRSLMIGITCQLIAMLYMAIFLIMDTGIGEEGYVPSGSVKSAATCAIVMIYISGFGYVQKCWQHRLLLMTREHLMLTLLVFLAGRLVGTPSNT